MLILKRILLIGLHLFWRIVPFSRLGLKGDLTSVAKVSLLLSWEDDFVARCVGFFGLSLLSFSLALTWRQSSPLIHLVALITSKCDAQPLLFEPGVLFASCGSMFLPAWTRSCHWDIRASYSEIFPQMSWWTLFFLLRSEKSRHWYLSIIFEEVSQK